MLQRRKNVQMFWVVATWNKQGLVGLLGVGTLSHLFSGKLSKAAI
jgi:hypothetical protein